MTQYCTPLLLLLLLSIRTTAQQDIVDDLMKDSLPKHEYVTETFKTTRIICGHSVEPTKKKSLDFRVAHRFGDIATADAKHTLLGFYAISDLLISLEYGATKDFSFGLSGAKGAGPLGELYLVFGKYRVLQQTKDFHIPLSISLYGNACISGQKNDPFTGAVIKNERNGFTHRFSFLLQSMIAIRATDWLSVQLTPTFLWRTYIDTVGGYYISTAVKDTTHSYNLRDNKALFLLGISARARVSKRTAILFEYFLPIGGGTYRQAFPMLRGLKDAGYYPCMNLGMEFETGGHVFHVNLTNTQGLVENDFLAYNTANWAQGQFRLGFTISRLFSLDAAERRAIRASRKAKK